MVLLGEEGGDGLDEGGAAGYSAADQELRTPMPRPLKSREFGVTTVRSCSSAVAAVSPPATVMPLPFN